MTHFKLGLLTLITIAAVVVTALALGLRGRPEDVYHTYFDESVHGLDISAQVKYRGVPVGSVHAIDIAPDHRYVRVDLAIDRARSRSLGLDRGDPRIRAQLALVGITGLRIVELDVVDPATSPPPSLAFAPAEPYIPSRPSLVARLGAGLDTTDDRLTHLVDRVIATLEKIEAVVDDVREHALPERVATLLDTTGGAIAELRRVVRGLDRADVPEKLASAIDRFDRASARLDGLLADVDTHASASELDRTLREVGAAARSVHDFMEQLEQEPDMLLKGRTRRGP
jgi:ABC-type transporter Mla subunit MlaD